MQTNFRKPCNECPFLKTSPAGYLGPWHPEDLLAVLANYPFACHQTIHNSDDDPPILEDPQDEFSDPRLEACAGAAIFLNNKLEISRHRFTASYQRQMKQVSENVLCTVFRTRAEFIEHHGPRFSTPDP